MLYPWNTKARNQRTLLDTFLGDDFFGGEYSANTNIDDYSVRTNVSSNNEEYRIDLIAPGLDRDDLGVNIENGNIYVSFNSENTDGREIIRYRSFTRYWRVPSDADVTSIRAEYKQGILSVYVPRSDRDWET